MRNWQVFLDNTGNNLLLFRMGHVGNRPRLLSTPRMLKSALLNLVFTHFSKDISSVYSASLTGSLLLRTRSFRGLSISSLGTWMTSP